MRLSIVGGGAAGLMAAAAAMETDPEAEIVLIEKNDSLGKKVVISGGGRCNVTTGLRDVAQVLTKYPRGGKFLNSAMRAYPPEFTYEWFEAHGVPLKIEEDLRVFPQSDNGHDIVGVFERLFAESKHVKVLLKHDVKLIEKTLTGFVLTFKDGTAHETDRVILTTGGQAYRHTGSTGDGYAFAEALGHHLTPLAPSLNSFWTIEEWPKGLSGVSFEKAKISALREKTYQFTGPFLFTHRGVSGPAVFALSSLVAFEPYDAKRPLNIVIDLFPDENHDKLMGRLQKLVAANPKKELKTVVAMMVPRSLAETLLGQLAIDMEKPVIETGKKDFIRIVEWLKRAPLTVNARGAGDEFVTAGGVELKEVDPRTMESKITPGLFFAGEILDIDGFTGGYNLQASWATGRVAGIHAVT